MLQKLSNVNKIPEIINKILRYYNHLLARKHSISTATETSSFRREGAKQGKYSTALFRWCLKIFYKMDSKYLCQ